ncbi:MAG: WbqC family protein, partial [Massilibacteroides sp.]|nr:WbqC family protein [Massilibacteroides sp.]
DHGNWRHLHWNALVSAYSTSPFFIYYQDDFAPFFEKKFTFLFDFNEELRKLICSLLDMEPTVSYTKRYNAEVLHDFREKISPKSPVKDLDFVPVSYYQVFREKYGFLSNLSIVDLLFNMGPEGLLVLQQSIRK